MVKCLKHCSCMLQTLSNLRQGVERGKRRKQMMLRAEGENRCWKAMDKLLKEEKLCIIFPRVILFWIETVPTFVSQPLLLWCAPIPPITFFLLKIQVVGWRLPGCISSESQLLYCCEASNRIKAYEHLRGRYSLLRRKLESLSETCPMENKILEDSIYSIHVCLHTQR